MKNNKGFTVIELILSFAFVSLLAASLFAAVLNYRDKEQEASVETSILQFKNQMTMTIQKDIEMRLLKNVNYCTDGSGNITNRCVQFNFMDDSVTELRVEYETCNCSIPSEEPKCEHIGNQCFDTSFPYITYGPVGQGIRYDIPDAYNLDVDTDYTLTYTTSEDDLENNNGIYKVDVGLTHRNMDYHADINIVANGLARTKINAVGPYLNYNIGSKIKVQMSPTEQLDFYVLESSSTFNSHVRLLYAQKDSEGTTDIYPDTRVFNVDKKLGNKYAESDIRNYLETTLYHQWSSLESPNNIKLLTFEQVASILNICPDLKFNTGHNDKNIDGKTYSYMFTGSYWLMSDYYKPNKTNNTSNTADNTNAWVINNMNLTHANVETRYGVKPVVYIDKKFILGAS